MTPLFLIAAGGTGGHVFPGLAVAEALKELADVRVVFVGTSRGLEKDLVPARGYELELMQTSPIKGGGIGRAIKGAALAAVATVRSFGLVRRLSPRVVLTVGGYSAGPVSLAAATLGVPVALLEPNSTPGLSNRIIGPLTRRAYVAFEETAKRFGHRARICGVPLRSGFAPRPYAPRTPPRVLVMGGSQGASALNERVPRSLEGMDVDVIHQCGAKDIEAVRRAYEGTRATVISFLDDVPGALDRADLVIARAGANTVAEIAAVGRASILIPFPFAADDHQLRNAMALARVGGALCIEQKDADVSRLRREVSALLAEPHRRVQMADAARAHGKPRAAEHIARDLLELARMETRKISRQSTGEKRPEAR